MPPKGKRSYKPKAKSSKRTAKRSTFRGQYGVAGGTRNFNMLNVIKPAVYKFKDSRQVNNIVGTGSAVVGVDNVKISDIARYSSLIGMFRKYRITQIKFRFRLRTIELTDQAAHPYMLLRWNYDSGLLSSAISEDFMLRQQNVVAKQFIHNTPDGCNLEYTIKPATMAVVQNFNGTQVLAPKFGQWIDFSQMASSEIDHYGIQYWLSTLPSGQVIDQDCQIFYECKDLI